MYHLYRKSVELAVADRQRLRIYSIPYTWHCGRERGREGGRERGRWKEIEWVGASSTHEHTLINRIKLRSSFQLEMWVCTKSLTNLAAAKQASLELITQNKPFFGSLPLTSALATRVKGYWERLGRNEQVRHGQEDETWVEFSAQDVGVTKCLGIILQK